MAITGKMWAHEHWGHEKAPDIVSFAKKMLIGGYYYSDDMRWNTVRKTKISKQQLYCGLVKGLSIKDVRTQGRGGLSSAVYFSDKGSSSDADVRTCWCKNFEFFEIYGCPYGQGELSQCGRFADKDGGG